jgi:hypothetical protein
MRDIFQQDRRDPQLIALGLSSRKDELQAVLLLVKFDRAAKNTHGGQFGSGRGTDDGKIDLAAYSGGTSRA